MEKISIQSTYTQVSLYARLSGPVSPKKPAAGDAAEGAPAAASASAENAADPGNGEIGRSKDGDTFTLSLEARTLRISESITIESGEGASAARATGSAGEAGKSDKTGTAGKPSEPERLTGSGLVSALMDALETIAETTGQGKPAGADGKHRPHFPRLSDTDDVADQVLSRLDQDHAAKGGSKDDFAAELKKRLGDWKSSASAKITVAYQEFRSEVHMKVSAGVDAWLAQGATGSGSPNGTAAGASAGDASGTAAGAGSAGPA